MTSYRLMNKTDVVSQRHTILNHHGCFEHRRISVLRPSGSFAGILAGLMRFIGIRFSLGWLLLRNAVR